MPVVVQVFSDYVCPYCYLGEVPLKKAAAVTGAEIVWRAFQLHESGHGPPAAAFAPPDAGRSNINHVVALGKLLKHYGISHGARP